jgi:hypothetical protein
MTWTDERLFLPPNPRIMGRRAIATYRRILTFLRDQGPKTKTEICEAVGLSSISVATLLRYGRERGQLRKAGKAELGRVKYTVVT